MKGNYVFMQIPWKPICLSKYFENVFMLHHLCLTSFCFSCFIGILGTLQYGGIKCQKSKVRCTQQNKKRKEMKRYFWGQQNQSCGFLPQEFWTQTIIWFLVCAQKQANSYIDCLIKHKYVIIHIKDFLMRSLFFFFLPLFYPLLYWWLKRKDRGRRLHGFFLKICIRKPLFWHGLGT